jgi:hypothetical protein
MSCGCCSPAFCEPGCGVPRSINFVITGNSTDGGCFGGDCTVCAENALDLLSGTIVLDWNQELANQTHEYFAQLFFADDPTAGNSLGISVQWRCATSGLSLCIQHIGSGAGCVQWMNLFCANLGAFSSGEKSITTYCSDNAMTAVGTINIPMLCDNGIDPIQSTCFILEFEIQA